ncbi:hypothetical protein ACFV11_27195 [Streptomyces globisporus]|uniref:hypothetical protein n=1 Tax=Streptomyces globisporus TaxID=1908 RepID=UPI0036753657
MTRGMKYCAACAHPLRRGTYRRCTQGCGVPLCRTGPCTKDHRPNCIVYQVQHGITEKP